MKTYKNQQLEQLLEKHQQLILKEFIFAMVKMQILEQINEKLYLLMKMVT